MALCESNFVEQDLRNALKIILLTLSAASSPDQDQGREIKKHYFITNVRRALDQQFSLSYVHENMVIIVCCPLPSRI